MQPEHSESKPAARRETSTEEDRDMNENPIPRISSLGGGAAFLPEPSISQLPLPPALSTQPLSSDGKLAGPQTPAPAQALFQESSPASTTSAFLLGIHNYKALEDVDLPKFVKEHQATLTFPEKLMLMLTYVDKERDSQGPNQVLHETSISWILDGRAFIIRNKDELVKHLLPLFFRQSKFASFTRKLYRWGFRQVSITPERLSSRREMIFGHEFFQRDNKPLMARMRSVTAAGTRRALAAMALKQQKSLAQAPDKVVLEPKIQPEGSLGQPGMPHSPLQLQHMLQQMAQAQNVTNSTTQLREAQPPMAHHMKQPVAPGPVPGVPAPPGPPLPPADAMMRLHQMGGSPSLQKALSLTHQQRALLNQNLTTAAAQAAAAAAALAIGQLQQQQQARQQQSAHSGEAGGTANSTAIKMEDGSQVQQIVPAAPAADSAAATQPAGSNSTPAPGTEAPALAPPAQPGTVQAQIPFPASFPQLAALGNPATTLAAAAHLQSLQQQHGRDGVDPNAYMRAAIDMLLRYASSSNAAGAAGQGSVAPGAVPPKPPGPGAPPPPSS